MHYLGLTRSTSHLKTQSCKETSKHLSYNLQSSLQISVIVHIAIISILINEKMGSGYNDY